MDEFQVSLDPGMVKSMYANRRWVPFASFMDNNYLGLDFDPGPLGTLGQVINFGREEEQKAVLADSFEEFVDHYATELETGAGILRQGRTSQVFLPRRFLWRFDGGGTTLSGYVAHRFIAEPS